MEICSSFFRCCLILHNQSWGLSVGVAGTKFTNRFKSDGHSPATLSRTRSVERILTLASSANKTGIRQFWLARHTGTPANLPRQRLRIDENSAHGHDYFQS